MGKFDFFSYFFFVAGIRSAALCDSPSSDEAGASIVKKVIQSPPIIIHSEDSTSISQAAKHDTDLIINKDLTACQNKEKFLIGAFYDFGKKQVALMGTVRKNGFLLVKCI